MTTYLLDANVFIQAKNMHYGLDFCPAFWDWLIANNKQKKVFSVKEVADEIKRGNDELVKWVNKCDTTFFLRLDSGMEPELGKVSAWANKQGYKQHAINTFFDATDYHLIAFALTRGYTVVTHEKSSFPSKKTVKIPDACAGVKVECVTPFEMLRRERARFILGPLVEPSKHVDSLPLQTHFIG